MQASGVAASGNASRPEQVPSVALKEVELHILGKFGPSPSRKRQLKSNLIRATSCAKDGKIPATMMAPLRNILYKNAKVYLKME